MSGIQVSQPEASPGTYKIVRDQAGFVAAAQPTGVYALVEQTTGGSVLGTANNAHTAFYFNPALYLIGGKATKLNLVVTCMTNAAAPTVTFTAGLYPITAVGGAAGIVTPTIGTVITGSTVAFVTPAATSLNQGTSGDFAAPAAGYVVIGVNNSGTTAASATTAFHVRLLVRQV